MAKMHLMGAALVAATVVAGCCDKENCNETKAAPETPAPAAEECCKDGTCALPEAAAEAAPEVAKDPNEVALAVLGKKLTRGEIDADVAKVIAAQGDRIPAEQLAFAKIQIANQVAQQFMLETILLDKAAKLGYTITDEELKAHQEEVLKNLAGRPDAPKTLDEALAKHPFGKERALEEMKNGVLIDKMLKAEVMEKDTTDYSPKAKEIIDRIVAENAKCLDDAGALAKINELKATLDATAGEELAAKFAEIAKAESACPSGKNAGGDLGEFTHGQMVKEFDEAAFGADIGKVVGPVKTQFGYHLIMTTKKVAAVEASDDKPGEPEKVQASHILIKVGEKQEVPEMDKVVEYLKSANSRPMIQKFIMEALQAVPIKASDDFKQLLPPPAAPEPEVKEEAAPAEEAKPAEAAEKAVETPAEK